MADPWASPFTTESDDYATSDDARNSWGTAHIDGKAIPIDGRIRMANLATLSQRLTFGDYTLSSDQYLSVWVQSDWTGGGQVEDLREPSHGQRLRHATAETTHPRMLTQPLETVSHTIDLPGMPATATPLGDYEVGGDLLFWAAFDEELRFWDTTTEAFIDGDTLSAVPVGKGVVFDDLLWIPLGSSGYDTWDGATVVNATSVLPIEFVEWDDKLVCLTTSGQVAMHQSGSTGWDIRPELTLKGDRTPRHLVVWWSQDGFPTLYVVTSRDVWAVDFVVPKLYRTGLRFPVHPDHGLAAASWRDDAMYVSVGVGVHQLSRGNVISAMGLDRDDGLPANFRGRIVDLEPEYNGLLALVEGIATVAVGDDESLGPAIEETSILDDALIVPESSSSASSTLQRYTGTGWHTVWESDSAEGTPTRVMVSEADGEYSMWWGYAGSMYRQLLRRTFYNPRQGAQLGIDRFALESNLFTGRFDANLQAFHKLASHVEVHLDPLSVGEMDIYYSTDHFDGQRLLGTVSGTGQQFLLFDPNDDGWYEGDGFHWIEFEYRLSNDDATETVIVNFVNLYFLVLPLQTRSWQMSVPLEMVEQWKGRGAQEIADQFDDLAVGEEFVSFKHRDRVYRVKVAQTTGAEATGEDRRSARSLSIIEIGPQLGVAA